MCNDVFVSVIVCVVAVSKDSVRVSQEQKSVHGY